MSACQTYNSKIAGSSPAQAIMLDLFLVIPSSNPSPHLYIIANWLPPGSWVFNPDTLFFELFVSKYLSGVPDFPL